MRKFEYGDIVLWGNAKGGGKKRNVVIEARRKYAVIRDEELHPQYTFRDVEVPIEELIATGEKFGQRKIRGKKKKP